VQVVSCLQQFLLVFRTNAEIAGDSRNIFGKWKESKNGSEGFDYCFEPLIHVGTFLLVGALSLA
jgi:hypothetical protein